MLDRLARVAELDQGIDADFQMFPHITFADGLSLRLVLTPSGVIGLSETSKSAPLGMWLTNPTMKIVAVSMSIAEARIVVR